MARAFWRTSLEATSRGCATIISNRGGLKETTGNAIILKKIESEELYKQIKKLIKNPKIRKKIQLDSRKNTKHLISDNTKIIDQIRESCIPNLKLNFLKKKIKIINIYNQGQKHNHRLFNISLGKKFTNGFIRNNYDVIGKWQRLSRNNKSFNLIQVIRIQKFIIDTFKNYNPDLLFFGHTKNIDLSTIQEIKSSNKNLIISQWNEDPVMPSLNYSKQNISNISLYSSFVDHNFITTHPSVIKNKVNTNNFNFFFVPVDKNIERFDVFNMRPKKDLFYAMSHAWNRAILKEGVEDERISFLDKLVKKYQIYVMIFMVSQINSQYGEMISIMH